MKKFKNKYLDFSVGLDDLVESSNPIVYHMFRDLEFNDAMNIYKNFSKNYYSKVRRFKDMTISQINKNYDCLLSRYLRRYYDLDYSKVIDKHYN